MSLGIISGDSQRLGLFRRWRRGPGEHLTGRSCLRQAQSLE